MSQHKPTFSEFLLSKGIVDQRKLPVNVLRAWRQAYEIETRGLGKGPIEVRVANLQVEELELRCNGGAELGEQIKLVATGQSAELTLDAEDGASPPKLPTFAMTAYNGGPIRPDGWYAEAPIIFDLEGMHVPASVPIDASHEEDIGHATKLEITAKSLKAKGILSAFDPTEQDASAIQARRMVRMAKNGFPFQASVQVTAGRQSIDFFSAGEKVQVNGQTFKGPVYVARQTSLKKIAILSLGADATTQTTIAAKPAENTMDPEFKAWLKANDLPENPSAEEIPGLKAAWQASKKKPAPTPAPAIPIATVVATPQETIDAEKRLRAAEIKRTADIHRICAKEGHSDLTFEIEANGVKTQVPIEAHAIEQNWTADQTELYCVRNARPKGPHGFAHQQDTDCNQDVLAAACMLRSGARLDHPSYATQNALAVWGLDRNGNSKMPAWLRAGINDPARNRVMDLAHRYASLSAIDLARLCCQQSAGYAPWNREELFRASFSSGSLTEIFTTSINARLVATYAEAPDTTQGWTQETEVGDFKINTDIRLTKGGTLTVHPRGAEADHHGRSDTAETYQATRFSTQFSVDEMDLIDDNLGALNDVPVEMGNGAARIRQDLVYAIILANPTLDATTRELFNATDNNLDTGSALASATLKVGIANMKVRQENGINLNLEPTHLIVPPSLEFLADELITSATILIAASTGASLERGSRNVLADRRLTRVSDSRLENGVTSPLTGTAYAGSASTWYLACALARTIIIAYLRGTGRMPSVRSFMLDKGKWGIGWDIKLDIGAKARDWRGVYRATA